MSKKTERPQKQILSAQREAVLKLADLQKELRDALHATMNKKRCPLGTASAQAGIAWKSAHGVYTGTRALGSGDTLKRLAAYVGKPQLEPAMQECARTLNDRLVGLSILEKRLIQTAFDVHEIFLTEREARKSLTFASFAKAFEERQDAVLGILNWQVESVRFLNDETAVTRFEELLTSKELSQRISQIVQRENAETERLSAEFRNLAERLLGGPAVQRKLAEILGTSASNVGDALLGRVPQARLIELIGKTEEMLKNGGKLRNRDNHQHGNHDGRQRDGDKPNSKEGTVRQSDNPSFEPAQRLKALIEQLRRVYGNEARLAKDLKLDLASLNGAINGNMGVEATEKVIVRARKLVSERLPKHPGPLPTPPLKGVGGSRARPSAHPLIPAALNPQPATPPGVHPEPEMVLETELIWPTGGTSDEGVPFVLDAKSFTPFAFRPSDEDIRYTARQIQHVRSLLNILTQISDDGVRESVRHLLAAEVEELTMTLRMFTEEYPNRMKDLFDAERQTMKALGMEPRPATRKGNR